MTTETIFDRMAVVSRLLTVALGILAVCFLAVVVVVWLVLTKQTQSPVAVQEAPAAHVQEDAEKQRLVNQLQDAKVQQARKEVDYKRIIANLQAQIVALTPGVQRVDDQIKVLNDAAQRTPPPMTDRELEEQTRRVVGIAGKVVRR